jgi:hypothetical protein
MFGFEIIRTRDLEGLENEVKELRNETVQLTQRRNELELKLFNLYAGELEEKLAELNLTSQQITKLRFICSIERARLVGVPEDKILHNKSEIDKFFTAGES